MLADDLKGIKERADPDKKRTWKLRGKSRLRPDVAKRGRPRSVFRPEAVFTTLEITERLGQLGATVDELAVFFPGQPAHGFRSFQGISGPARRLGSRQGSQPAFLAEVALPTCVVAVRLGPERRVVFGQEPALE
jgi:hypothetical protein